MDHDELERILQADRVSLAAVNMGMPDDAVDAAIPLLEHSVTRLEAIAQSHRRRLDQLSAHKRERENLNVLIIRLPTSALRCPSCFAPTTSSAPLR